MKQYNTNLKIQNATSRELWGRLQTLFVKPRNLTFNRIEIFIRKQGKTETIEEFHCGFTELVVKGTFKRTACNDGGLRAEKIRDLLPQICLTMRFKKTN